MAKLTFLGAAGTVTGSKYLVEAAGKKPAAGLRNIPRLAGIKRA
jgi:hypothetical protein